MPTIKSILASQRPLHHIPANAPVSEAVRAMVDNNVGALPVLEDGRLVGIFSERDLMRRVVVKGLDAGRVLVRDVMSTDLVTADINDDHITCLNKMNSRSCRHLPVVEANKLVGFLSARDLMKADADGKAFEIESLTQYIYYLPPNAER
ncbi:MAG: CBS domain-containing protein [Candidatus Zixiibacteriota bacterium]